MADPEQDIESQVHQVDTNEEEARMAGDIALDGTTQELTRHHFTGDTESQDPTENEALAWEMAHAGDALETLIAKSKKGLENAKSPETVFARRYLQELEENSEAKMAAAEKRFFREQERAKAEKEIRTENIQRITGRAIDTILVLATGDKNKIYANGVSLEALGPVPLLYVEARSRHRGFPVTASVKETEYAKQVEEDDVEDLRTILYEMVGAEPPISQSFDFRGSHYPPTKSRVGRFLDWSAPGPDEFRYAQAEIVTPGTVGLSIVERRESLMAPEGRTLDSGSTFDTDQASLNKVELFVVREDNAKSGANSEKIAD